MCIRDSSTSDLRIKAAHQLDVPHVVQFMIDANLHVEVTAVGLLAATSRAMGQESELLINVLAHVPSTYQVSAVVVMDYIAELAKLVEFPAADEDEAPPPPETPIFG